MDATRGRVFAGEMEPDEAAAMAQVAQTLRRRFPRVSAEEMDRVLAAAHHAYDGRPIRHFVPILVEREVTETLRSSPAVADVPAGTTRTPAPSRQFAH